MLTAESDKKLFLLDAYALIFRAYYAFIRNHGSTARARIHQRRLRLHHHGVGRPEERKADPFAVVFDPPGPTFRHEEYTEYKANRDETPEDIRASVPRVLEVAEAMRIPTITIPGYEADDTIGALSVMAEKEGLMST